MARIFWNDEEKKKVADMAAHIVASKHVTYLEAMRRAQEQLPEARRRPLISLTLIPWAQKAIDDALAAAKTKDGKTVETKIVEKVTVIPIRLHEVPTDELLGEMLARIATNPHFQQITGRIVSQFIHSVKDDLPSILRRLEEQKHERKEVKPDDRKRILVVGLLGEQENEIEKRHGPYFRLSYFKDGNMKSLREKAHHSDKIIFMTKFCSHSMQDVLKATGTSMVMCNGAVSELSAILDSYFEEAYK